MGRTMTGSARMWLAVAVLLSSGVTTPVLAGAQPAHGASHVSAGVHLWDTVTQLRGQDDVVRREAWRAVTPGAASHLEGDLVVETEVLAAAFASQVGKVLVYSKAEPSRGKAEVFPAELSGRRAAIASATIAEESGVVTVQADFRALGANSLPIAFSFASDRILAITPRGSTRGISLSAPLEVVIVPSFVGDDLIYDPRDYPSAKTLSLPSEHFLLGLLSSENSMLVMTWQEDVPSVQIALNNSNQERPSISTVSFVGPRGLSLAVLDAPGIWHRQSLNASSFLERDTPIAWRPPFPAVWLTQLYEDEVKTTYEFRQGRDRMWRGGVGYYTYPAWFSNGKTMLSLGKKITPEGEAIIYFLEPNERTGQDVLSPIAVARRTLTGDVLADIVDEPGRQAWFPQRPNPVIGAATCAVTDALKEIFDSGQEVEKQAVVKGGVEDMYFYLERMLERDGRFYPFAKDMIAYLEAQRQAKPEVAALLQELRTTAEEIVTTYDNARDTIKDMDWAHQLGTRTIALAAETRPDNPQRMADLKQDWTSMGGALEELARREHTLTRKLYQQAGYRAAVTPEAMSIVKEVRRRTKQCLESPESYEIWANY